jgi:Tfp pilus assembly protein PilF
MRTLFAYCALVLFAALTAVGQAPPQPERLDTTIREVRKLIDGGHATEALAALRAIDAGAASTRAQARVAFYEARAYQKLGDQDKAVAAYEHAIAVEPSYGPALNNLALLFSQKGNYVHAAALLRNAIAIEDPRRPLYLNNYAAAAEKAGDIEEARRAYAQLAAAQPDNVDAQLQSIRLLNDPNRMALQLMKLCNRGEVNAAQSLALDLLAKAFNGAGKRALLSVVAGTLAAQHVDPRQFALLPVASRLDKLRADPLIADGIAEILLLYGGNVDADRYRWWRSPERDEHFTALIRDAGSAANNPAKSEAYFKLALDYADGTDTSAFIELADLYYSQSRFADLDALAKRYEKPMFAAKSASISTADYAAEYRFHIALGTMYAYTQGWGNDHDATSAIFQLTQAGRAAADYNRTVKWGPRIPNDPKTYELLATAYQKSNDLTRAMAIRVDAAAAFAAEGRKTAATGLLKPIKADPTIIADPAVRLRYTAVIEKLAKPFEYETEVGFSDSVDVAISSVVPNAPKVPPATAKLIASLIANYVLAETDEDRDRAENTLRKLGVSDLDPTTMSRVTGEFVVEAGGRPQRYRYTVRSQ